MKVIHLPFEDLKPFLLIPERAFTFLERARYYASQRGFFLYLAGGLVRDALLKRASADLDLVLEGNWEELLPHLLEDKEIRLLFKSQFLTFKIRLEENFSLDLVTSRKETYLEPASLPVVEPSNFKEDVLRRDFTINALLYGLTPPYEECLLDLVSGLEDLEKGLIRPLKLDSFIEDPTRAFRGVRYKVRLGFNYAEEFHEALRLERKSASFERLSPSRLSQELKLFFTKESEENLFNLIEEAKALGLFERALLKVREIKPRDFEVLRLAREELRGRDLERFYLLFLVELEEKSLERLNFSTSERELIFRTLRALSPKERFFSLSLLKRVTLLSGLPPYLLFRLALCEDFQDFVWDYLKRLRFLRPELTGKDLLALGIEEGERIGKILKILHQKRLEGEIKSKEEEIALVQALIFQGF